MCTPTPLDTCDSVGTNNRFCLGDGTCGCNTSVDCLVGYSCDATNHCAPCNTADNCGTDCADCRTSPFTPSDREYFTCTTNAAPISTAGTCAFNTCPSGGTTRINCDGVDVGVDANAICEVTSGSDTADNDPDNCAGCGIVCASRTCTRGRCECPSQSDTQCPTGVTTRQTCTDPGGNAWRCECGSDGECPSGYWCDTSSNRNRCYPN